MLESTAHIWSTSPEKLQVQDDALTLTSSGHQRCPNWEPAWTVMLESIVHVRIETSYHKSV